MTTTDSGLSLPYNDFFVQGEGRSVRVNTGHSNRVALIVSNKGEPVPHKVLARFGGTGGVLNFAGATAVKTDAERQQLFWYITSVFGGNPDFPFRLNPFGAISGGTRVLAEGVSAGDPTGTMTIVEAPGILHRLNPLIRTAGHAPRTGLLGYGGTGDAAKHSSFSLEEDPDTTTIANPDIHLLWLVQPNASDTSEWDGDLEEYMDLLLTIQSANEGEAGQFLWSGGGVTVGEIHLTLKKGVPMLLNRGSGRATDDAILAIDGKIDQIPSDTPYLPKLRAMLEDNEISNGLDLVTVADITNPRLAQRWLEEMEYGEILAA